MVNIKIYKVRLYYITTDGPLESLRIVPKIVVATRSRIVLYLFIF